MSVCQSTSGTVFPTTTLIPHNWLGLKGKGNGELLRAAELAGYDVLPTVDQGMPQQHRSGDRNLAIVLIRARTNRMEDLLPLVHAIFEALKSIKPSQTVWIPEPV